MHEVMRLKKIAAISMALATGAALTKDDILFILSLIVMILNAVIEYLKSRKEKKKEESE